MRAHGTKVLPAPDITVGATLQKVERDVHWGVHKQVHLQGWKKD